MSGLRRRRGSDKGHRCRGPKRETVVNFKRRHVADVRQRQLVQFAIASVVGLEKLLSEDDQSHAMSSSPTSRAFVTNIVSTISSIPTTSDSPNPLKNVDGKAKELFLTLHVLFPNELLPALDLLDRGLISRFSVAGTDAGDKNGIHNDALTAENVFDATQTESTVPRNHVYYVRSAQHRPQPSNSRYSARSYDPTATNYEVRLTAWNCSCPAFAFSAFPSSLDDASSTAYDKHHDLSSAAKLQSKRGEGAGGGVGGLDLSDRFPICKHLLACVLSERCAMFHGCVEQKTVSVEELAGWAAGWGG